MGRSVLSASEFRVVLADHDSLVYEPDIAVPCTHPAPTARMVQVHCTQALQARAAAAQHPDGQVQDAEHSKSRHCGQTQNSRKVCKIVRIGRPSVSIVWLYSRSVPRHTCGWIGMPEVVSQ